MTSIDRAPLARASHTRRALMPFEGLLNPLRRRGRSDRADNPLLEFASESDRAVAPPPAGGGSKSWRLAALLIAVIVATVAGSQWRWIADRVAEASPPVAAKVSVITTPPGAEVIIDGERRGVTPLVVHLRAGAHSLTLRNEFAERVMTLTAGAGADIVREVDLPRPVVPPVAEPPVAPPSSIVNPQPAPAMARSQGDEDEPVPSRSVAGFLVVRAPFEVQLIERGEVVGTSGMTRIMLGSGRHDLQIVNRALDFHDSRRIDIAAGGTSSITVSAPLVAVNINARPWAEVTVDGAALGQTPIANTMLAIGTRRFVFRHPEHGERSHEALITTRSGQRIAVDLTK